MKRLGQAQRRALFAVAEPWRGAMPRGPYGIKRLLQGLVDADLIHKRAGSAGRDTTDYALTLSGLTEYERLKATYER